MSNSAVMQQECGKEALSRYPCLCSLGFYINGGIDGFRTSVEAETKRREILDMIGDQGLPEIQIRLQHGPNGGYMLHCEQSEEGMILCGHNHAGFWPANTSPQVGYRANLKG